jgi:hypothetical protein
MIVVVTIPVDNKYEGISQRGHMLLPKRSFMVGIRHRTARK